MDILEALVSLLAKDTVSAIESEIFKYLIESKLPFYLHNGKFWALYTELIFLDPSRSYLEKRSYIIKEVWSKIPKKHNMWDTESLIEICNQYMPEDIGSLDACLLTNGEEKNLDEKEKQRPLGVYRLINEHAVPNMLHALYEKERRGLYKLPTFSIRFSLSFTTELIASCTSCILASPGQ